LAGSRSCRLPKSSGIGLQSKETM